MENYTLINYIYHKDMEQTVLVIMSQLDQLNYLDVIEQLYFLVYV